MLHTKQQQFLLLMIELKTTKYSYVRNIFSNDNKGSRQSIGHLPVTEHDFVTTSLGCCITASGGTQWQYSYRCLHFPDTRQ